MNLDKIKQTYVAHFKNKHFLVSFLLSISILVIALVVNYYAGLYANERASNSVTDVILSNIRLYDIDGMFIYGPLVIWIVAVFALLTRPRRIPFMLKSIGLFILIRSIFISLTHIGPFPTRAIINFTGLLGSIFPSGADLFFSGHTGLPFLLALIFWENIYLRVLYIISALFFGTIVLMGHLHYSIDVLAAFFITYTIYHIAESIFHKDKKIFAAGI
jgi:hypothetical protein